MLRQSDDPILELAPPSQGFWGGVHGLGRIGVDAQEHDCGGLWGASVLTAEFIVDLIDREELGEQVIVALLMTKPPRTPLNKSREAISTSSRTSRCSRPCCVS